MPGKYDRTSYFGLPLSSGGEQIEYAQNGRVQRIDAMLRALGYPDPALGWADPTLGWPDPANIDPGNLGGGGVTRWGGTGYGYGATLPPAWMSGPPGRIDLVERDTLADPKTWRGQGRYTETSMRSPGVPAAGKDPWATTYRSRAADYQWPPPDPLYGDMYRRYGPMGNVTQSEGPWIPAPKRAAAPARAAAVDPVERQLRRAGLTPSLRQLHKRIFR